MKKMGLWCLIVGWGVALNAVDDDIHAKIATLVQEDINGIKGHCDSINDSKVFKYVMQHINKKKVTSPGFADRHDFEIQQLITDTTNYNETYKTLCGNGGIQSNIFSALITEGVTIDPYVPLREQALNVIVEQLQALMSYTR